MPHTTIRCEVLRIKDSINHLPKTCFLENPRGNPALNQEQAGEQKWLYGEARKGTLDKKTDVKM